MPSTVRAAGGVLHRPAGDGIEVALVHRPRYDDWSLPKGKLEPGETALAGALREVREETGWTGMAGRTLGTSSYVVPGEDGEPVPKTVRWWAVQALDGEFVPGDEVDELRWLPPTEAESLLTAGRDLAPLRLLVEAGLGTTTVLLVRHARAGDRASWPGPDDQRPLDPRGAAQAQALAEHLSAYGVVRVLSAPVARCVQTVTPLADRLGLTVELEPAYGDAAHALDPDRPVGLLEELAAGPGAVVVCSQGGAIPALVQAAADAAGLDVGKIRARKGSTWALTFRAGVLVDADQVPPLA